MDEMTSRQRVLAAINHQAVDRVPTDYWGTAEATLAVMRHLGVTDGWELWGALGVDKIVNVMPGYLAPVSVEGGGLPRDSFGVEYKELSYESGVYDEIASSPLARFDTIDEIEAGYEWPTADMFDFSTVTDRCLAHPNHAREGGYMAPFYIYTNIRGLENCLMDLAANPDLAHYIIAKICGFLEEFHTRLFDAGKGEIDIAQVTDDFGTQSGLMISLDMFEEYFREPYERFISMVKNRGIRVFHHDDGAIMDILPRMVEMGIDVLNPVQWHLPGMSLEKLAGDFGDRIAFHGGIDNQHVLPFGSPDEIEEEVRSCLTTLGRGSTGYILAPCHNVQANTPPQSVVHMYEMARKHGRS